VINNFYKKVNRKIVRLLRKKRKCNKNSKIIHSCFQKKISCQPETIRTSVKISYKPINLGLATSHKHIFLSLQHPCFSKISQYCILIYFYKYFNIFVNISVNLWKFIKKWWKFRKLYDLEIKRFYCGFHITPKL
jgi:hypothetical protein